MSQLKVPLLAALFFGTGLTQAQAHAFRSGGGYDNFIEGAYVILAYPGTLLPIVAAGILVGLWHPDGSLRALPIFAVGLILGFFLSPLIGQEISLWMTALGIFTAVMAALLSEHAAIPSMALAFLTGVAAMMVSLEGHTLFELAPLIYAGLFFTGCFVLLIMANATRMAIDRFPAPAAPIAFRILASWIAAMLFLFLAFAWRG